MSHISQTERNTVNILRALILICFFPALLSCQETVRIHGRVTDFEQNPIAGAQVRVMDPTFHPAGETVSDALGQYELRVPRGQYMALLAIRDSEYRSSRLEYWAWDVPATNDLEINPRYHRMEIYAMNAFRPQGGYPSYMIYFRPMSLSMVESGMKHDSTFLAKPVIDIAPPFTKGDLEVHINDEVVPILAMSRVRESGGQSAMFGYLVQCALPKGENAQAFDRIRIVASDRASGDKGEGLLFVRKLR